MRTPDTAALVEADLEISGSPAFAPPIVTSPEVRWRHEGWKHRRDKIRRVLGMAGGSATRLERWDNCGSCAVVEHSKARKRFRVTCWHCRDRWCQPCQTAKRCQLVKIVTMSPPSEKLRFLTFTLRHCNAPLKAKLIQLRKAFRKLLKTPWWKARVVGGVAVLEVKLSSTKRWHPHLHVVVDAAWMDKGELSDQWKAVTGGSFVADVRSIDKAEHAAGYIAKYLTKGIDASVLNSPDHLTEAIIALRGARSFDVFGEWRGERTKAAKAQAALDPDETCASDFVVDDWQPVATLREMFAGIAARQEWALGLHKQIFTGKTGKDGAT